MFLKSWFSLIFDYNTCIFQGKSESVAPLWLCGGCSVPLLKMFACLFDKWHPDGSWKFPVYFYDPGVHGLTKPTASLCRKAFIPNSISWVISFFKIIYLTHHHISIVFNYLRWKGRSFGPSFEQTWTLLPKAVLWKVWKISQSRKLTLSPELQLAKNYYCFR